MAALNQARMANGQTLKNISLPLDGSQTAYIGGRACGDTSTGGVKPGQASTTLIPIGKFLQNVDNSGSTASVKVMVQLDTEIFCDWWDNATGANKVLAANVFSDCYMLDDHTVTLASSGNSKAGRVWGVDAKGVLVQATRQ